MQIKPVIGSVVGQTDERHWGQVLTLPQAYGVIEVYDDGGMARERGVGELTKLSDLLEKLPKSLSEVKLIADEVANSGLVTLILLVPVGKVVYLVLGGKGAVYLKRGSQLACLLKDGGQLSGEVAGGDTLLLLSKSFISALSEIEIAGVFDHLRAPEAAEKLTLLLHEVSAESGGAGLVFQVNKMIPVEEENVVEKAVAAAPVYKPGYKKITGESGLRRYWSKSISYGARAISRFFPRLKGKNKLVAVISVLLITLFITSIAVGLGRQLKTPGNSAAEKTFIEATRVYEEGIALLDLNTLKGREKLTSAKQMLAPLLSSVSPNTILGRKLKSFDKQISDSLSLAAQITKAEPQLFYDAGLLKSGAIVSSMGFDDGIVAILDKTTKSVYSLNVASKKGTILAGGEAFADSRLIATHGDFVYVLSDQRISSISLNDKTIVMALIKAGSEWGRVSDLVAFGGNLYLLDTGKNRIWKYVATDRGFSDLKEYLNPDTLPDLSRTTGMSIDGSIWLGAADGKILKFTQGKADTFLVQGVDPPFAANILVSTNDGDNNLYVLDANNKRIVVLDKSGTYVAQYVWTGNLKPTQIFASEKLKKIFLLIDGKIYTLELK